MGGELLTSGGVIAAFFAGGVALFAPCCIVFLAPSYMAAAVKNRMWRLLPLTFVFAAGLALILVPLTLGTSLLAGAIAQYHALLYYAGGILMIALAVLSLLGRMWSLPRFIRAPDTRAGDSASFFALGVFSGIASSCCAPVLIGVVTLSALSGSPMGGIILGLAYVFGMVFPLFVMALIWDRARLADRPWMRMRTITLKLAGRTLVTNPVNLAVAIGFAVMGVAVIALADSPNMTRGTAFQAWIAANLTSVFMGFEKWLSPIPDVVQALLLFLLAGLFVWGTLVGRRKPRQHTQRTQDDPSSDADNDAQLSHTQAESEHSEHSHCASHDSADTNHHERAIEPTPARTAR